MHTVPTVRAAALCLLFAPWTAAQASDLDSLVEKRDAKWAGEWLKAAHWIRDFDAARREASKNGELIFAYFSRSFAP